MSADPAPNIGDVALIFEGGGMRAALTSAVVIALLDAGLYFPWVAGISAGASNTVNYVSRDRWRARASFTSFVADPQFGNLGTWMRGKGLFNADYIYRQTAGPDQALPFNFPAFHANPAEIAIQALRCSDAATITWHKADVTSPDALMARVQASSTMPVIMPPVDVDGDLYVDGALGPTGGIALDAARAAGFSRFVVVLTQERDYVKKPLPLAGCYRRYFRRFPAVAEALLTRHDRYNATRAELFDLAADGDAYLFIPDRMPVGNGERDLERLVAAHHRGVEQATREIGAIRSFVGH
ncbi:MAG: patatin family protein [Propioniciclava sp.]